MLRLCDRMKWSLETFNALSPDEKQTWLDYDAERLRQMDDVIEQALKPTGDDGTVSGEIVTARALLALLRIG